MHDIGERIITQLTVVVKYRGEEAVIIEVAEDDFQLGENIFLALATTQ